MYIYSYQMYIHIRTRDEGRKVGREKGREGIQIFVVGNFPFFCFEGRGYLQRRVEKGEGRGWRRIVFLFIRTLFDSRHPRGIPGHRR
jgi:hypothetical protein